MTPERAQELPDTLRQVNGVQGDGQSAGLPDVLLDYQAELLATTSRNAVTICEKSRRIGMTWAIAADAVLTSGSSRAAGGMDTLYIGYNLDMAREFIDTCAMWARAFMPAATSVEEFLFMDQARNKPGDKTGDEVETAAHRNIQAFRITFASGYDIVALTSKPRSLRGRQGFLIFDEAAFHDDLDGMMKAGLAFLMWGGKILVISTHDGENNSFNGLVNDCRSGRKPYALVRTTFDDAIRDGLYERIRLMQEARGLDLPDRQEWVSGIRAFYGDDGDEELDAIPSQGTGTALSGALIEMRMNPEIPVLRWEQKDSFSQTPLHLREIEAREWCEEHLKPLLDGLPQDLDSFFGEDFGRVRDLTVIWPVQVHQDLVRRPPFVVEMANIPFEQQKQVLFYMVRRLPRFRAGALDAGGNGAWLAEAAADEFGHGRIAQIKFSVQWYRENMPRFIAAFEDGLVALPRDRDVLNDHRLLKKVDGVVRVPTLRTTDMKNRDKKRHGDSAIAHALAYFSSVMETVPMEFRAVGQTRQSDAAFDLAAEPLPLARTTARGFGTIARTSDLGGI